MSQYPSASRAAAGRQTRRASSLTPTTSDAIEDEELDGQHEGWPGRLPTSARRYQVPPRASAPPTTTNSSMTSSRSGRHLPAVMGPSATTAAPRRAWRARFHWLVFVGLAMLVMIIGWLAFTALSSWWQTTQDDWHYGRPRTFQIDAVVGHDDSPSHPSHFIAINLDRHVVVIELPGGDASKARIYNGPTLLGPGQDLTPVTLSFRDVNGDGLLDMLINVAGSQIIFYNEHGSFRPPRPGEVGSL